MKLEPTEIWCEASGINETGSFEFYRERDLAKPILETLKFKLQAPITPVQVKILISRSKVSNS